MTPYSHQIGVGGLVVSEREKQLVNEVLDSGRLTYGPKSKAFEEQFSSKHNCKYGLFLNSGTSALHLSLQALKEMHGWSDGDEVIVPSVTFVATSNIVIHNNMKPVFADVEPTTYNIDPKEIEKKITKRTRAIIPVHLLGLPASMGPISDLAKTHNLKIIEDSCETMFATYQGKPVGSLGDIACFSTYVAHFLVTGVGGLVTTNDLELAKAVRSLMNHGRDNVYISCSDDKDLSDEELLEVVNRRFRFERVGHSFRCTELEAALGIGQLERADEIIAKRSENALKLTEGLSQFSEYLQLPHCPADRTHSYMLYGVALRNQQLGPLVNYLEKLNIETRPMLPLINQPIYKKLYGDLEKQYPVAKWLNSSAFYLGCHSYMDDEQIGFIINAFKEFFNKS